MVRPKKPDAEPADRVHLGFRVTPEMKQRIEDAARDTGRSQSQEAEFRLEASFHKQDLLPDALALAYGPGLAAIILMIAEVMSFVGSRYVRREALERHLTNMKRTMDALRAGEEPPPVSASWLKDEWLDDPAAFEDAIRAAMTLLEARRPPTREDEDSKLYDLGEAIARKILLSVASGDNSGPDFIKSVRELEARWRAAKS